MKEQREVFLNVARENWIENWIITCCISINLIYARDARYFYFVHSHLMFAGLVLFGPTLVYLDWQPSYLYYSHILALPPLSFSHSIYTGIRLYSEIYSKQETSHYARAIQVPAP